VHAIRSVAVNVFKESVRDRVPYNLVLFAVLLISSSYLLGQLTAGQDVKIVKDLGLSATAVFGLFIAVFIGIGLVSKEVERRSIYPLLAKPVSRPQFIAGKYAGLVLTLCERGLNGTFHCCGGESTTRMELARTTIDVFGLDASLLRSALPDPHALPPERVPYDTSLDARTTAVALGVTLPSLRDLLVRFRAERVAAASCGG